MCRCTIYFCVCRRRIRVLSNIKWSFFYENKKFFFQFSTFNSFRMKLFFLGIWQVAGVLVWFTGIVCRGLSTSCKIGFHVNIYGSHKKIETTNVRHWRHQFKAYNFAVVWFHHCYKNRSKFILKAKMHNHFTAVVYGIWFILSN